MQSESSTVRRLTSHARHRVYWLGSAATVAILALFAAFLAARPISASIWQNAGEPQGASSSSVDGAAERIVPKLSAATGVEPVAPAHGGDALCIHYDVFPVTMFYEEYLDGLGHRYHGWQPPAGPPFYVSCPDSGDQF